MRVALFILAQAIVHIGSACCGRTHADIRYTALDGSTYRFDVVVYSCLSAPFDLPEIEVSFDQAAGTLIPRTGIMDDPSGDIRRSEYTFNHDFVENGIHTVDAIVGGRPGGLINIPNSISETMCIRAVIHVAPTITPNNSIQFGIPPTIVTRSWNAFVHTPAPSDPDGDSLVFQFGIPKGIDCLDIAGYQLPMAANFLWIDPENGTFIWDYPTVFGEYSLTIIGSEYRNGQLVGQVTRDMTICVAPFAVGMDEVNEAAPFSLYPSLTDDLVTLLNRTNGTLTLDVVAAHGALVGTYHAGPEQSSISLGHLAPGVYIVQARALNGTVLHSTRLMRK
jgi:hypothetical protein